MASWRRLLSRANGFGISNEMSSATAANTAGAPVSQPFSRDHALMGGIHAEATTHASLHSKTRQVRPAALRARSFAAAGGHRHLRRSPDAADRHARPPARSNQARVREIQDGMAAGAP